MPRYQQLDESRLDETQRRIWDDCKAGPRGSVPPPVHVWLKSPGLADFAHRLGAHRRAGGGGRDAAEAVRRAGLLGSLHSGQARSNGHG